jgi:raffinose/stachyose/melibiose transport system substrate-binding protein
MAGVAILYNRAIFARLHLAVPRTLSAFEQACARVKRAGLTPLGLGNADGWLGDDWWLTLVNARVGPAALASELRLDPRFSFEMVPLQGAAATLQQWASRGYFTPNFGGLDAQDSMETFFQGHTAMQLVSSTENSQILSLVRRTGVQVGIFPFPSAGAGRPPVVPVSGYEGWAVPRAARNPDAAIAFIDQMTAAPMAQVLLSHGMLPAHRFDASTMRPASAFQRQYLDALDHAAAGVYLDSAPIPNLNATMEANIQLLLQNVETPAFLTRSLQDVYTSRGTRASSTRTDGEF